MFALLGSELSAVLFDFNHDVVDIDKLGANVSKTAEWWMRQNLLEAMVVLDELCQNSLKQQKGDWIAIKSAFKKQNKQKNNFIGWF